MNCRGFFLLLSFVLLASSLPAQQVSVHEVQSRAYDFLKKQALFLLVQNTFRPSFPAATKGQIL